MTTIPEKCDDPEGLKDDGNAGKGAIKCAWDTETLRVKLGLQGSIGVW